MEFFSNFKIINCNFKGYFFIVVKNPCDSTIYKYLEELSF